VEDREEGLTKEEETNHMNKTISDFVAKE